MRILHLSCIAPPEVGGIGSVAAMEVRGLVERGYDAAHAALNTHPSQRLGNAGRIYALEALTKDQDIVHLHYPFMGTDEFVARLRKNSKIRRLVVTFHMDAEARGLKGRIFEMYRRHYQESIMEAADVILVSSLDYARSSSASAWMNKMVELPFGINEHVFCPIENHHSEADSSDTRVTILFVGGMDRAHAFKGVPVLLDALTLIPHAHAVLVGDGNCRASFEAHAASLGLSARVTFAGRLGSDEIIRLYQSASLVAFPSTGRAEAFGLVALEAHACGTPVIASDLPGVRTVVRHGETGLLVPPEQPVALADAIGSLLGDPNRRASMGAAARASVLSRFTASRHMDDLLAIYQRVCASSS